MTASGTPASVAVEMQPRRAQTPEKSRGSAPANRSALRIMSEKADADGALSRGAPPGRNSGKRGAQAGHLACGRACLVQRGPGVVPHEAMNAMSLPTMSVSGREPRPMRG